jgi:hypothetical protein
VASGSVAVSVGVLEIWAPEAAPRTFSAARIACQWESKDSPDVATVLPLTPSKRQRHLPTKSSNASNCGMFHLLTSSEFEYERMFAFESAAKLPTLQLP